MAAHIHLLFLQVILVLLFYWQLQLCSGFNTFTYGVASAPSYRRIPGVPDEQQNPIYLDSSRGSPVARYIFRVGSAVEHRCVATNWLTLLHVDNYRWWEAILSSAGMQQLEIRQLANQAEVTNMEFNPTAMQLLTGFRPHPHSVFYHSGQGGVTLPQPRLDRLYQPSQKQINPRLWFSRSLITVSS